MKPNLSENLFERALGMTRDAWLALNVERRGSLIHERIPDLAWFLTLGEGFQTRPGAPRSRALAASLFEALGGGADRLITDPFLLSEHDRDQNVYLGPFYTRVLTRAVPDLVFQPVDARELAMALRWARERRIAATLRGAGTTAMGGAVPGSGGLLLDLSRMDSIHVDAKDRVVTVGAGARMRTIHERAHAAGLMLRNYPSNLGGTLAGWFCTGGIGLNAYGGGECREHVKTLEVVLPTGLPLRFHDDGRLDVLDDSGGPHRHLAAPEAHAWLASQGLPALRLADFAGTEGQFGVVTALTVATDPHHEIRPHLVPFDDRNNALRFVEFLCAVAERCGHRPATLKYLSARHLEAVHEVWREEGRVPHDWRRAPGGYVYFDFDHPDHEALVRQPELADVAGRDLPGMAACVLSDRFRPQQVKRLGPGLLAAEVLVAAGYLPDYFKSLDRLSKGVRVPFEYEAYYLRGGRALVLASYLTDPARAGFFAEVVLAPVIMDLAARSFGGSAYVLGRWSAAFFDNKFDAVRRRQLRAFKRRLDSSRTLNGTIFFGLRSRFGNLPGWLYMRTFRTGLSLVRALMHAGAFARPEGVPEHRPVPADEAARAASCVNCGECNSVCPVFHEAKVRLPQILTHMGERLPAATGPGGAFAYGATESTLLDLCLRCGNCAEACQAGIPHLPLFERMQETGPVRAAYSRTRHELMLGWVRTSQAYLRRFLKVRPGVYKNRAAASLPGEVRFVLRRAENEAGPSDTCIHCGACVPVCPTSANFEFQDASDARRITTEQDRCVGCGTCVEVCPANLANGGRTLRVMEAPGAEWLRAVEEFERIK